MTRLEAFLLVRRYLRDRRLLRVCLATEAVMEDLATRLAGDPASWGQAGLLAWLDFELTEHNPKSRGAVAAEMLRAEGAPAEVAMAVGARLQPGPHSDPLTRALAAAEAAAWIVLEAVEDRRTLTESRAAELVRLAEDPSVAPQASRTRVLALEPDGLGLEALLDLTRGALLRASDDLF